MSDVELWKLAFDQMRHHQKPGIDASPRHAINRILSEYVRTSGVSERSSRISRITLGRTDLAALRVANQSAAPRHIGGPVVIVRIGGVAYVVDGNRRVNAARASAQEVLLDAIVIEPEPSSGTDA